MQCAVLSTAALVCWLSLGYLDDSLDDNDEPTQYTIKHTANQNSANAFSATAPL